MGEIIDINDILIKEFNNQYMLPFVDKYKKKLIENLKQQTEKQGIEYFINLIIQLKNGKKVIPDLYLNNSTIPFYFENHIKKLRQKEFRQLLNLMNNIILKKLETTSQKKQFLFLRNIFLNELNGNTN